MSYPRGLDEFTDLELAEEIDRREKLRAAGKCDYCERSPKSSPCKFEERHYRDIVKKQ